MCFRGSEEAFLLLVKGKTDALPPRADTLGSTSLFTTAGWKKKKKKRAEEKASIHINKRKEAKRSFVFFF